MGPELCQYWDFDSTTFEISRSIYNIFLVQPCSRRRRISRLKLHGAAIRADIAHHRGGRQNCPQLFCRWISRLRSCTIVISGSIYVYFNTRVAYRIWYFGIGMSVFGSVFQYRYRGVFPVSVFGIDRGSKANSCCVIRTSWCVIRSSYIFYRAYYAAAMCLCCAIFARLTPLLAFLVSNTDLDTDTRYRKTGYRRPPIPNRYRAYGRYRYGMQLYVRYSFVPARPPQPPISTFWVPLTAFIAMRCDTV